MNERLRQTVHGMLGGMVGAGCMTVLRLVARRRGLVDKAPPQAAEGWIARRLGWSRPPGGVASHQALSELFHLGYGIGWGALYGALVGRRQHYALCGLGFAAVQWAVGFLGYMPALGIAEHAREASPAENAVNLASHALWGYSVGLALEEFGRQHGQHSHGSWKQFNPRVG